MPSKTFLNLSKEKQNKLLLAATYEFSINEYEKVSINQIIMKAGISRGSFYMYFNDKDDLFDYLIQINRNKLAIIFKNSFKNNDGDLYNSFLELYDQIVSYIIKTKHYQLFKNAYVFFSTHKEDFSRPGYPMYEQVKDLISTNNLKENDLKFIFLMLFHHLFMSITYCINNNCLEKNDYYKKKLYILCYGIYKEEKKV